MEETNPFENVILTTHLDALIISPNNEKHKFLVLRDEKRTLKHEFYVFIFTLEIQKNAKNESEKIEHIIGLLTNLFRNHSVNPHRSVINIIKEECPEKNDLDAIAKMKMTKVVYKWDNDDKIVREAMILVPKVDDK